VELGHGGWTLLRPGRRGPVEVVHPQVFEEREKWARTRCQKCWREAVTLAMQQVPL